MYIVILLFCIKIMSGLTSTSVVKCRLLLFPLTSYWQKPTMSVILKQHGCLNFYKKYID